MVNEEQEQFFEEQARRCRANGDDYFACRNSNGDIENMSIKRERIEKAGSPLEEATNVMEKLTLVCGAYDEREYYDLVKTMEEMMDLPWYARALNHVKAVLTGKGYGGVLKGGLEKKLDKQIHELEEQWDETKNSYQQTQEELAQLKIRAENLVKNYHDIHLQQEEDNPDPDLKVKGMETEREIHCTATEISIYQTHIDFYESVLPRINSQLTKMKSAKLNFEVSLYSRMPGFKTL